MLENKGTKEPLQLLSRSTNGLVLRYLTPYPEIIQSTKMLHPSQMAFCKRITKVFGLCFRSMSISEHPECDILVAGKIGRTKNLNHWSQTQRPVYKKLVSKSLGIVLKNYNFLFSLVLPNQTTNDS